MAKLLRLPKLNSWAATLVLASIGLHGLVLALPMPSLVETPPEEPPELPDPEVIQVVTLPQLATGPEESEELPLPEPPQEEPPPEEEPEPEEDPVLSNPEILDDVEPEVPNGVVDDLDKEPVQPPNGNDSGTVVGQTELDRQLQKRENYGNFNAEKTGADYREGGTPFKSAFTGWITSRIIDFPDIRKTIHLSDIEAELPSVISLKCLPNPPSDFVSVIVQVSPTDSSLIGDPETLNSTGYEILDKKALEIAREADYGAYYKSADPASGYWFNVQVEYEPCE